MRSPLIKHEPRGLEAKRKTGVRNLDGKEADRIDLSRGIGDSPVTVPARSLEKPWTRLSLSSLRNSPSRCHGFDRRKHSYTRMLVLAPYSPASNRRDSPRGRETNYPVLRARNHAWNNGSTHAAHRVTRENTFSSSTSSYQRGCIYVATIDSLPAPTATRCIRVKATKWRHVTQGFVEFW